MSERPASDPTVQHLPTDPDPAATIDPDSGPPLPAHASVLKALGAGLPAVPRVYLRGTDDAGATSRESARTQNPVSRYRLQGEIARGGMGAILRGHDNDLGREIAVKVLLETHKGRTELLQRFVEEAQIGGQLQHPGIVPVYELGQFPDKRPYFTMKLVKGRTLAALLAERKDPVQDRPRFLKIFEQICQTLAYAHSKGVIHRDLKPANIMVGAFGEVQVMDWGLAKVLPEEDGDESRRGEPSAPADVAIRSVRSENSDAPDSEGSHTHAGSVLGTPAYMPPEQARGDVDRLGTRSDVFGLGAILCEILTGKPPYGGGKSMELLRKAAQADLADARARLDASETDVNLKRLAKRCLAPDPNDRPRDAGILATELTAYLEGVEARLRQAELASAEAKAKAIEERKRRKVTMALAASVLIIVLLGVAAGFGSFASRKNENARPWPARRRPHEPSAWRWERRIS